jgi:DNA-binding NtrC family response regulator
MAKKAEKASKPASRRRRFLVVDDEPEIVDILSERFTNEGHTVVAAHDGTKAMRLVRAKRPDLVFLDIQMPGLSGIEVLKAIKKLDPALPVIMITANVDDEVAAEAIREGAFSYVPKPLDFRYLDHLVALALGG